jgi:hypothetical protein
MRQGDRIQSGHQYGFFMIPNEMIDSHIENMGALGFVVYSVLMRHANASSQCFPSYSTLVKKSSLSRPTIAKCIEHLVTKGYIRKLEIGHSKGHATTYQLLDLSLVPTSKGDLPVNEPNQSTILTSKGDLPVTSKGDLPVLVNDVNSNNTPITKPINNNTHIRAYENFENKFNPKINRHTPKGLETEGFAEWHLGRSRNDWHDDLLTVAIEHLLAHEKPAKRGDAINFINNICFREDWSKFELLVDKAQSMTQKTRLVAQKDDRPRLRKPNPLTWTEDQKNWTYEQWEQYLNEQNQGNASIYATYR